MRMLSPQEEADLLSTLPGTPFYLIPREVSDRFWRLVQLGWMRAWPTMMRGDEQLYSFETNARGLRALRLQRLLRGG